MAESAAKTVNTEKNIFQLKIFFKATLRVNFLLKINQPKAMNIDITIYAIKTLFFGSIN